MFRRPLLSVLLVLAALLLLGLLVLGAFPPRVTPQPVERVVPNERFAPR